MATFRGISYPFRPGAVSFPAGATDDELIQQDLIQLIMTKRGERVMRPDFGTNILALVFENNNDILQQLVRSELMSAITRHEPRVIVQNIDVARSEAEVIVTITYVVVATSSRQTLELSIPTG